MSAPTLQRKSVPVDETVAGLANEIRQPGTAARAAVEQIIGDLPGHLSEAQALTRLLEVARVSIAEQRAQTGYAALAASLDEEDRAYATASKARRAAREARRSRHEPA